MALSDLQAAIEAKKNGDPAPEKKKKVDTTALKQAIAYRKDQRAKQEAFMENPQTQAAKQVLASTSRYAAMGVDFVANPLRVGAEYLLDKDIPTLAETVAPDDVLPEGTLKDVADTVGLGASIAPSFTNVARSGGTVLDTVADLAGFGSSGGTQAMRQAEATSKALLKAPDSVALTKSDPQIRAQAIVDEIQIDANRAQFNTAEKIAKQNKKLAKDVAKEAEGRPVSAILRDEPTPMYAADIDNVAKQMQKEGFTPEQAIEGIVKSDIKFDKSMDELIDLDQPFKRLKGYKDGGDAGVSWYDRNFLPIADAIRKYVDPEMGAKFERSVENGLRASEQLVAKHGESLAPVAELINKNRDLKRAFLNVGQDPKQMNKILMVINKELGGSGTKAFTEFMRDSLAQNKQAQQRLFRPTNAKNFNEKFYFHTERHAETSAWKTPQWMRIGKSDTEKPSALRNKTRKDAYDMKDKMVDEYENPLLSQMRYMADQKQLLNMAEAFGVRPVLGVGKKSSRIDTFFNQIGSQVAKQSGDEKKGKLAASLMNNAYMGSRAAPPPMVRAFMSLAYAGTLAQVKSAVLNLHDPFVSAFRMGGDNVMKGVGKTLRSEFGKNLEELGLGSQGIGEYVKSMADQIDNPTMADKVAKGAEKFTNGAMYISGFQALDKIGKGAVLRTAVNKFRQSARQGRLSADFGEIATERELRMAQEYLKKGTKVKDMPQEVAAVIEDMAFVQLGKQQLISYAGRPINYLKYPLARPLWAMTGFAVKQQALLRDMIGQAIRAGDYAGAGAIAARYVAYAGVGYAGIDSVRDYAVKGDEITEETLALALVDQILGAALMNKLDTGYGLYQFEQEPIDYLLESFLPPTGITGAAAETVVGTAGNVLRGEPELDDKLLERIPLLGDFYKYYWKKNNG